jgi:DNA polymerase-3 subunit delta
MQTINEDIKNGTFKPVYLLYGEEAFLKQSYKKKLRAAISGTTIISREKGWM